MSDVTGVGSLAVTASAIAGIADSDDPGTAPDGIPLEGTVKFTPKNLPDDYYLLGPADIVVPYSITCFFHDGKLYMPANGQAPAVGETPTTQGVTLIAPQQGTLDWQDWFWEARFNPPTGAEWPSFAINFTGAPDDDVVLSSTAVRIRSRELAKLLPAPQPTVWVTDSFDIPVNAVAGQYLLNTAAVPGTDPANYFKIREAA